ncbi:MAG TPA: hypothetical protein VJH06_00090 [Candidatus Paceibacterota bacterium]
MKKFKKFGSFVSIALTLSVVLGSTSLHALAYEKNSVNFEQIRAEVSSNNSEATLNKGNSKSGVNSLSQTFLTTKKDNIGSEKNYVEGEILVKYKNNKINLQTVSGRASASNFIRSRSLENKEDIRKANVSVLRIKDSKTEVMTSPEIMHAFVEDWKKTHATDNTDRAVINIENTKKELLKFRNQEDRFTKAYSEGVITLEKLKEFIAPYKDKISSLEKNLVQASLDQKPKLNTALPSDDEIGVFAKEATEYLNKTLSFESKKGIIRKANTTVYSNQKDLQVHGFINLNELYVKFFTEYRNRRSAKRGEVHAF